MTISDATPHVPNAKALMLVIASMKTHKVAEFLTTKITECHEFIEFPVFVTAYFA
jgi:hypothetical protein